MFPWLNGRKKTIVKIKENPEKDGEGGLYLKGREQGCGVGIILQVVEPSYNICQCHSTAEPWTVQ